MRETLRLQPPAVARAVYSEVDTTVCGGKYAVKANQVVAVQNWCAMKDSALWGEDAKEFKPKRMLDGKFEALPVREGPSQLANLCSIILRSPTPGSRLVRFDFNIPNTLTDFLFRLWNESLYCEYTSTLLRFEDITQVNMIGTTVRLARNPPRHCVYHSEV